MDRCVNWVWMDGCAKCGWVGGYVKYEVGGWVCKVWVSV